MKKYKYPKIGSYLLFIRDFHVVLGSGEGNVVPKGTVAEICHLDHICYNDESMPRVMFGYNGMILTIDLNAHKNATEILEGDRELEAAKVLYGEK